jgi:hypothetical protein
VQVLIRDQLERIRLDEGQRLLKSASEIIVQLLPVSMKLFEGEEVQKFGVEVKLLDFGELGWLRPCGPCRCTKAE